MAYANLSEVQSVIGNKPDATGSGGVITWAPNSTTGGFNTQGNTSRPAFIGLAHELYHGSDANQGILYPIDNVTNSQTGATYNANHSMLLKSEWRAVYRENLLRGQLNMPLRTHYGVQENSPGILAPTGPRLIDGNNKPINYPK